MDKSENPLVSVVIATYNSVTTVLETLDSIKEQTYKNIELIITDDCSKDDTVAVCEKWLKENQEQFVNTMLVTSSQNTGVAPNLNRGIKVSKGKWIKSLAGDDTLRKDAIEKYIVFTDKTGCRICLSKLNCFGNDIIAVKRAQNTVDDMWNIIFKLGKKEKQYKYSLKRHILPGPGLFYQRTLIDEIGGFDERYPMSEEYSFENRLFKLAPAYALADSIVNYRIASKSLSGNHFSVAFHDDCRYFWNIRCHFLFDAGMYLDWWDQIICYYVEGKGLQGNRLYFAFRMLKLLSPLFYYRKMKLLTK